MYRSWLFIPGNREKFLQKAQDLQADVVIYDLEDAVPNIEKQTARVKVKETISTVTNKANVVRINTMDSAFFMDDVKDIISENLAGIMLPKTNSRDDILILDFLLGKLEEQHGLANGSISIIPLIESAIGLKNINEIASAGERIQCLSFGAEDYMLDLNISPVGGEQELNFARSSLIVASKAASIEAPIDSVYTNFRDDAGFKQATLQSKQSGFQGKLLIHPDQIEVVNDVFSPTQEEITEAKQIVERYTKSLERGEGAISIKGKMIDVPAAERAKSILAYADSLKEC